ncbi:MAG: aldo/keto reductase [Planctomycetes bacterium]|nr:aldo/keto reductase [Planctomycetota bacterium]
MFSTIPEPESSPAPGPAAVTPRPAPPPAREEAAEIPAALIPGAATPEGTARYRARQEGRGCAPGHFRTLGELWASSLGVGTYLGRPDERTDALVTAAVQEAVRRGVNVVDTAINYRYERGERCVGEALRRLFRAGEARRDEVILCTKGGFIPHPEGERWFRREFARDKGCKVEMEDLAAGCHCMHPEYIIDQVEKSRRNLGVETLDVYYLHNPETQLSFVPRDLFHRRLRAAFETLERLVRRGHVAAYGLATWPALREPATSTEHIDLAHAKSLAGEAARAAGASGPDAFRFVQLPLNLAMREALTLPTQQVAGDALPAIEAAGRLGLFVAASASICQAQVVGHVPRKAVSGLGDALRTDAQRALQFTRSAPGLSVALVGMKEPAHVEENLALAALSPLTETRFREVFLNGKH